GIGVAAYDFQGGTRVGGLKGRFERVRQIPWKRRHHGHRIGERNGGRHDQRGCCRDESEDFFHLLLPFLVCSALVQVQGRRHSGDTGVRIRLCMSRSKVASYWFYGEKVFLLIHLNIKTWHR